MPGFELEPHQATAVDKMHNGCVLRGGTGVGKSVTVLAYWYSKVCKGVIGDRGSMRTPTDIYVITTAKKRDKEEWEDDAAFFGLDTDEDISVGATRLHVDSWNNIKNYRDIRGAFFVFDEQKTVGSGAWSKAVIEIAKHNEWVLLSATPGDTWLDYVTIFIANGFYKNKTEFMNRHVEWDRYGPYPKVKRFHHLTQLIRHRDAVLVEMPYERHTTRQIHMIDVDYNEAAYTEVETKRWHVYEKRPIKDVGELFRVRRKIANSDPSRLSALRRIMETHPRVIVFYNFDYELEILRQLAEDSGTSQGRTIRLAEWNGHKHEEIPDGSRWVYLVQYNAGSEGWNCVRTDTVVFYTLTYSYKQYAQGMGRIDRLNTPFEILNYFVLRSKASIDTAIWRALEKKENFQEGRYAA